MWLRWRVARVFFVSAAFFCVYVRNAYAGIFKYVTLDANSGSHVQCTQSRFSHSRGELLDLCLSQPL